MGVRIGNVIAIGEINQSTFYLLLYKLCPFVSVISLALRVQVDLAAELRLASLQPLHPHAFYAFYAFYALLRLYSSIPLTKRI